MLDLMRSDIAAGSAESSTETVARALAALTPSDLVRLKRLAQLRARLLPGLEWEELLNEALLRALDGSRRWPEGVPLLSFIAGIMRSLLDGRAQQRRRLAERALAVCETSVTAAPDARLHARRCLAAIAHFFASDPDVLALIATLARQHLGGTGHPAPQLSRKRREAARKRLARAILRGHLDEFLP
ncbi:MAG TPA: hypothetical protein VEQ62_10750 [Stellaceae bacterium]|nr:hypothetical protein [Stellaceae bacterium]